MSKITITLIITIMFMFSCVSGPVQFNIDQDSQKAIIKIMSRRVGYELAKKCPKITKDINLLCQDVIGQDNLDIVTIAINRIVTILTEEIDDPLIVSDIQDILTIIKFETGISVPTKQLLIIKAVAEGLTKGIEVFNHEEVVNYAK